jgi:tRNA threonylcarbamoyladenosine biosynthesis protein TsaE
MPGNARPAAGGAMVGGSAVGGEVGADSPALSARNTGVDSVALGARNAGAGPNVVGAAGAGGVEVADPDAMRSLGAQLAGLLRPGDLVVLAGPLGAGKTVFVQGIAAGLGATGPVTSPTFVIARVHRGGRVPFVHVDAYRLGGVDEVDDLDLDADLASAVTAVEWGAGLVEHLTRSHLRIDIDRPVGDDAGETRQVRLVPSGPDWANRLCATPPAQSTNHGPPLDTIHRR